LFITGTTHRRIPLFRDPTNCKIFLDNVQFYRRKYRFDVLAYVLMPDHYHLLLVVPPKVELREVLRDFKSAVGRQVIVTAKKANRVRLLSRLRLSRSPKRFKDARFRALQADNYVERIFSEKFFQQKLNYIHTNPVQAGLVEDALEHPYSSAKWYVDGGEKDRAQWQGPLG